MPTGAGPEPFPIIAAPPEERALPPRLMSALGGKQTSFGKVGDCLHTLVAAIMCWRTASSVHDATYLISRPAWLSYATRGRVSHSDSQFRGDGRHSVWTALLIFSGKQTYQGAMLLPLPLASIKLPTGLMTKGLDVSSSVQTSVRDDLLKHSDAITKLFDLCSIRR